MVEKNILIVGAGPAGLAAAAEAARNGVKDILVVDLNIKAGGQLFKQIHKFFGSSAHRSGTRGIEIGKDMLKECEELGVEIWLNSTVQGIFDGNVAMVDKDATTNPKLVKVKAKKIIIATGASENAVRFKGWTLPGVMGAGAAQTMINVNRVKPGKRIVMLGSGNVGLIVSYQLMQAGCNVVALVEALPGINGYGVHAAKISRAGVPIYTRHTVVEAIAGPSGRVAEVVIAEVDEKFQPVPGTEKRFEADTVAIGAGLKPISKLLQLAEVELLFDGVLGGWVPKHNRYMETTVSGIYVAGDATGVEEANTALEEGKLAGVDIAEKLGALSADAAAKQKAEIVERLRGLRMGSFGDRRYAAKEAQIASFAG